MVATCTRRPLEVLHEVAQAPWSSGHECGVNPCGATSLTGAAALELQCRSPSGCSSMVELQLPKLLAWVRFPSPAPPHHSADFRRSPRESASRCHTRTFPLFDVLPRSTAIDRKSTRLNSSH